MLCSDAQHTHPSSSLPTPCITNTVLIPLPTWLYLLTVLLLVLLVPRSANSTSSEQAENTPTDKPSKRGNGLQITQSIIYYLLIIATLGMLCLEIARFAVSEQGIGLLPFTLVGTLGVCAVRYLSGSRARINLGLHPTKLKALRLASLGWWVGVVIMYAVGTAVAAGEMNRGVRVGEEGFGSMEYPLSDQVTDRAVILGVAFVQALLEALRVF